jgi:hypothetical protein
MQGIGGALPEALLGKTAGQGSGSPGPEVSERHSDTEEVTGSNPVRPTIFECMSRRGSQDGSGEPGTEGIDLSDRRDVLQ